MTEIEKITVDGDKVHSSAGRAVRGGGVSTPADELRAAAQKLRAAGDLEYIAAMHPGVGAALADWLDRMADATEQINAWTLGVVSTLMLDALAVARQINGLPEQQTERPEMTDETQIQYPHQDGEVTVLGPEIFVSSNGDVICWRGENYVRQPAPTALRDQYEEH